ncbi:MAG: class I SAM-dependent methyltransferase [Methanobacteriota archaeon]|nr:MAG: class I SAM-dependent methyltransferase [Euryarchaeota archaeon]
MKVEWRVDPEVNKMLWEKLSLFPVQTIGRTNPDFVLDLGGGSGDFASPLMAGGHTTVISLDTDLEVLKNRVKGVQAILGDATRLPFKDSSIDGVTARAILHHFPLRMDVCLAEVKRVLKEGELFLVQEPLAHNFFANMARRSVLTERHEAGEQPLDPSHLDRAMSQVFHNEWKEHHFLLSYLLPHLTYRVPDSLKGIARRFSRFAKMLDERALNSLPGLRKYSAYVTILGRKA